MKIEYGILNIRGSGSKSQFHEIALQLIENQMGYVLVNAFRGVTSYFRRNYEEDLVCSDLNSKTRNPLILSTNANYTVKTMI